MRGLKKAGLKKNKNRAGFTLIELILVLGIFAGIALLSMPFLQTFQASADLNSYANVVLGSLRRAQQQSIAGINNSSWGVYFDNSAKNIILFKGENYSARDQAYDQQTSYPEIFNINSSFGQEIVFSKQLGLPSAYGTLSVSDSNNEIKAISITDFGLIQIND